MTYEPQLEALDRQALLADVEQNLALSRHWSPKATRPGIVVSSGFLPTHPCRAYRTDLEVTAPAAEVVDFIADRMFEELPKWNREFLDGEVMTELDAKASHSANHRAWLMRVFYATPSPLKNREYLYLLERHARADGSTVIAYQSVDADVPVREGFVRGLLHRTVHRVVPLATGGTRLEHILAGDIRGGIPQWAQSHLFAGGFVAANLRDALAQQRLLDGAEQQRSAA